jgi:hypothetical protein
VERLDHLTRLDKDTGSRRDTRPEERPLVAWWSSGIKMGGWGLSEHTYSISRGKTRLVRPSDLCLESEDVRRALISFRYHHYPGWILPTLYQLKGPSRPPFSNSDKKYWIS